MTIEAAKPRWRSHRRPAEDASVARHHLRIIEIRPRAHGSGDAGHEWVDLRGARSERLEASGGQLDGHTTVIAVAAKVRSELCSVGVELRG